MGECLDLSRVVLNHPLLEAAARFWIPSLGIFKFGNVELSPSLEEVSRLTGLPLFRDVSVLPPGPIGEDLFTFLFNADPRRYDLSAPNESPSISLDLFYGEFSIRREHPGTLRGVACRNALILGILAEILLLSDVFLKLSLLSFVHLALLRKPLVPTVLAGIHEGLTQFHEGSGSLQGCLAVLQTTGIGWLQRWSHHSRS